MPFENFYKEADRYAHRWRWCLIAAIFFIAAYFAVPFFLMWLFEPSAMSPPVPKASEAQRLAADALCKDLPLPELLWLASVEERKTADVSASVVYTYTSERGFDEILPPFLIWFEREGWRPVFDEVYERREVPDRVHNFRYRNQRVSILYFEQRNNYEIRPARFEIVCTVEKPYP